MYNIVLDENEEIKLISDNTIVYNNKDELICTSIITNKRYLILDYPSDLYNTREDLRILNKLNYVKQKEVIFEINLDKILSVEKDNKYYKININKDEYILIDDIDIINYLKISR